MVSQDRLRWFRAAAKAVDLESRFSDAALLVRRKRGTGRLLHEWLTPEEGMVLSRTDAHTSIKDLCGVTGFSRPIILQVLYALVESGILELVGAETIKQESKGAKELETVLKTLEERVAEHADDPCRILGVNFRSGKEQVNAALLELLGHFHPDRMHQYRRWEKRASALIESLVNAHEQICGGAHASSAVPASAPSKVASVPHAHPKNGLEKIENLCAEAASCLESNHVKAIELLEKALRLDPDHTLARLMMGNVLLRVRDLRHKAEEHFRAVLAKDSHNADAWAGLTRLYFNLHMMKQAAECLLNTRKCDPLHPGLKRLESKLGLAKTEG